MTKLIEPEEEARREGDLRGAADGSSIWETIDEIMRAVPEEALRRVPTDGAEQHDHYLYGAPKKAPQES